MRALVPTLLVTVACSFSTPGEVRGDAAKATPAATATPAPSVAPPKEGAPPKSTYARKGPEPAKAGGPLVRIDIDDIRVQSDVLLTGGDGKVGRVAQCDPALGSILGQIFYVFGDDECNSGVSVSFVEMLNNGADAFGCQLRWMGTVSSRIIEPFAGIGHDLEIDPRNIKKVYLDVRGDGNTYRADCVLKGQLDAAANREECDSKDWDYYGQEFVCGDGTNRWQELVIEVDALQQRGFGTAYPLDKGTFEKFQISTTRKDEHDFQCEFAIRAVE